MTTKAITRAIDRANHALGAVVSWCAVAMMLFQVIGVILRYVFGIGLITFQEAVIYGHSLLFLLAAAWVLQRNEHVRVDVIYGALSARRRRFIDLVGIVFFILPVCAVIGWISLPYVVRAWSTFEGSRQAGGLPGIFLLKTAIVVFALSVASQALSLLLKRFSGVPDPAWDGAGDDGRA